PVCPGVNFFALQGAHEALASRVVIGTSSPAHAGDHLVLGQDSQVVGTGILYAAVGVMHNSRTRPALCNRPFQGSHGQPAMTIPPLVPPHNASRNSLQGHSSVEQLLAH